MNELKKMFDDYDIKYVEIKEEHLTTIYNLFTKNVIPSSNNDPDVLYYIGNYYRLHNDCQKMIHFLSLSAEQNHIESIINLAHYYEDIGDKCNMPAEHAISSERSNTEKYYTQGINQGSVECMADFGGYYQDIGDYDNMMKYYQMAIDKNNTDAMVNLGDYYATIQDYEQMKSYYIKAAELGNRKAMLYLVYQYKLEKDLINTQKYYMMSLLTKKV